MITIRFKDYLIDKASFDRLFDQIAASPSQSKPFEALAEKLGDALREYTATQKAFQKEDTEDKKMKLGSEIKALAEEDIKISHTPVPRASLEKWLKMSVNNYVQLTKHKVIGK